MKFLLLVLLSTVIAFFVWNILRRIFQGNFYGNRPQQHRQTTAKRNDNLDRKVNWDAETVEYEEVTEEKKDQQ